MIASPRMQRNLGAAYGQTARKEDGDRHWRSPCRTHGATRNRRCTATRHRATSCARASILAFPTLSGARSMASAARLTDRAADAITPCAPVMPTTASVIAHTVAQPRGCARRADHARARRCMRTASAAMNSRRLLRPPVGGRSRRRLRRVHAGIASGARRCMRRSLPRRRTPRHHCHADRRPADAHGAVGDAPLAIIVMTTGGRRTPPVGARSGADTRGPDAARRTHTAPSAAHPSPSLS